MAWSAPKTYTSTETLTHTDLNTYQRDNQLILKTSINDDGSLADLQSSRVTSNYTNSTVTLTDVTGLSFTIGSSEVWEFRCALYVLSPAAGDIKLDVTVPSGASGRHGLLGARNEPNTGSAAIGTVVDASTVDSVDLLLVYTGTVVNSTTAGTVQVQAAQLANSGTTTIYANSSITATKIA